MAGFSVGPAVLLVTLAILAAPPAFAASVTYSVSPYKPEEKEVAQAFERETVRSENERVAASVEGALPSGIVRLEPFNDLLIVLRGRQHQLP